MTKLTWNWISFLLQPIFIYIVLNYSFRVDDYVPTDDRVAFWMIMIIVILDSLFFAGEKALEIMNYYVQQAIKK